MCMDSNHVGKWYSEASKRYMCMSVYACITRVCVQVQCTVYVHTFTFMHMCLVATPTYVDIYISGVCCAPMCS